METFEQALVNPTIRATFKELLKPSNVYMDIDEFALDSDFEPETELEYTTPGTIRMFRQSEIYRLKQSMKKEENIPDETCIDFVTYQLKKILQERFDKSTQQKPLFWP
jgi:hypothetical protein